MRIFFLVTLFFPFLTFTLDKPENKKFENQPLVWMEQLNDLRLLESSVAVQAKDTVLIGTNIDFEKTLKKMRFDLYYHPKIDIINDGYRPIGGSLGDFAVGWHANRFHIFYIERRLKEGTPFFPGHEIFFGHASTTNFFDWEVHEP